MGGLRACVDVGSTWTKALLVDTDSCGLQVAPWGDGVGRLTLAGVLATAQHPTTLGTDVMDGVDAVLAQLAVAGGLSRPPADPLVCSSAGGGLRLAVVGFERAVTAEAGRRAALSAGGLVVHVGAGLLDRCGVAALLTARPDVVVLTGGTDGGDTEVLLHNADVLARELATGFPVVVAGNADVAPAAAERLRTSGVLATLTANVLPVIGELQPGPAREAVRAAFLRHVIGGDRFSTGRGFAELVVAATPDVVLAGVERLAATGGAVLVVDVGGATTDVYSVVDDAAVASVDADVAGRPRAARSVEGDLGMRWSAPGVLAAAATERLVVGVGAEVATSLTAAPDGLPTDDPAAVRVDADLARLAATVAVRRHSRPAVAGGVLRPLRDVGLVVGSGGVLRHGGPARARAVLGAVTTDHGGLWHVPDSAALAVDVDYALCALGLLSLTGS